MYSMYVCVLLIYEEGWQPCVNVAPSATRINVLHVWFHHDEAAYWSVVGSQDVVLNPCWSCSSIQSTLRVGAA
jgi:hypothetical protein